LNKTGRGGVLVILKGNKTRMGNEVEDSAAKTPSGAGPGGGQRSARAGSGETGKTLGKGKELDRMNLSRP